MWRGRTAGLSDKGCTNAQAVGLGLVEELDTRNPLAEII